MSAAILTRRAVPAGGLRSMLARVIRAHARWCAERRAAEQLHAMSDRQLADLGLHRAQIDALVRGARRY